MFGLLAAGLAIASCSSSEVRRDDGETARKTPAAVPAPGVTVPPTPRKLVLVDSGSSDGSSEPGVTER